MDGWELTERKGKKKGKGSESHLMQTDHRLRNQKHHPVKKLKVHHAMIWILHLFYEFLSNFVRDTISKPQQSQRRDRCCAIISMVSTIVFLSFCTNHNNLPKLYIEVKGEISIPEIRWRLRLPLRDEEKSNRYVKEKGHNTFRQLIITRT